MISASSCSSKIIGMDWSKRDENSEISIKLDDFGDQELVELSNFIIVHGAGSLPDTLSFSVKSLFAIRTN